MKTSIEEEEIVIKLDINILPVALAGSPYVQGLDTDAFAVPVVSDYEVFAKAVLRSLTRDDGSDSSILTRAFDQAMRDAIEEGCQGVEFVWTR